MTVSAKIIIERRVLNPTGHEDFCQRVATVYIGQEEYRVLAPSRASGDPLDWVQTWSVRQPSRTEFNSETEIDGSNKVFVIKLVQEEFALQKRTAGSISDTAKYYHVRFHFLTEPKIEVRLDLRKGDLEKRILEPYRNLRPITLGGRTMRIEDVQRIEIFESPRPSSAFGDWTAHHLQQGVQEPFYGESDVRNVTDELITTPAFSVLPQKTDAIELLCLRFHVVARQLRERHEDRRTLDVTDEYDVQDLLHALLRLFFDDVRPEEWTPSYAGKSSRMDFLLPTEQTVVEVKKTRAGLGAKELGNQLIEDIARYRQHQSCKRLICFVYDPEARITNPRGIETDLAQEQDGFIVKVIIAPMT